MRTAQLSASTSRPGAPIGPPDGNYDAHVGLDMRWVVDQDAGVCEPCRAVPAYALRSPRFGHYRSVDVR
jgi:hypothetical protein